MDIAIPPVMPNASDFMPHFVSDGFKLRKDITSSDQWILSIPEETQITFTLDANAPALLIQTGKESVSIESGKVIGPLPAGNYRISKAIAPEKLELLGAYPNPFNSVVEIAFSLDKAQKVTLEVFDITGKRVTLLSNKELERGRNTLKWNAQNEPSGLYFYKLNTQDKTFTGTMSLVK
jgi:hypothetical protein